ncbi:MAG: hypothetical protein ACXABD_13535 [Candidatus Thorarchaeota archaeon]
MFRNDTIVLKIGEREIFRESNVTTKLTINTTEIRCETEVKKGKVSLHVGILTKGLEQEIKLDIRSDMTIGIRFIGDFITWVDMDDPSFGLL